MGPSFICLPEDVARQTLKWSDKTPMDFTISNPTFDLRSTLFSTAVPIYYNRVDKKCGYFGPLEASKGTYSFDVSGTRKQSLGTFTKINTSRGEPIVFKIADWTLPRDAAPGSQLTFEYKISISEQRDDVARPVVDLGNDNPAARGYRSSIDANGVVILTYQ
jgi:hypothetical protein